MSGWAVRSLCALPFVLNGALAAPREPFAFAYIQQSPVPQHFNEWAVIFKDESAPFREQADRLAEAYGLINLGQVGTMERVYHFMPRSVCGDLAEDGVVKLHKEGRRHCLSRRALVPRDDALHAMLNSQANIEWAGQQEGRKRVRRSAIGISLDAGRRAPLPGAVGLDVPFQPNSTEPGFNDPLYPRQWHFVCRCVDHIPLHNDGEDIRVYPAWNTGLTGRGVVVTVVDDGLEHLHPDLSRAYDPKASIDLNDNDDDPTPRYSPDNINKHGTRCAGEIAAEPNNQVCGAGVAFDANVGGIRLIDADTVTDRMEADALSHASDYVDIYSSSWGPDDDGRTVEGPGPLCMEAIKNGIKNGRKGKGSIYVFAAGNGRREDNCNSDGYTNSIYTLSIGAVDYNNEWPWYSEPCSATIASTYSSGADYTKNIVTVDFRMSCTDKHTGTSAAAPLAAGIFALTLQANPSLTWRDVQHLIIATSRQAPANDDSWFQNGIGRFVSHKFGYGVIDTARLVYEAKLWRNVSPQVQYSSTIKTINSNIPDGGHIETGMTITKPGKLRFLEHVTVNVTIAHMARGELEVFLTSPAGTVSQLLTQRPHDQVSEGYIGWTFMTLFNWGESPIGNWTLKVADALGGGRTGTVVSWQLNLFGTEQQCDHTNHCRIDGETGAGEEHVVIEEKSTTLAPLKPSVSTTAAAPPPQTSTQSLIFTTTDILEEPSTLTTVVPEEPTAFTEVQPTAVQGPTTTSHTMLPTTTAAPSVATVDWLRDAATLSGTTVITATDLNITVEKPSGRPKVMAIAAISTCGLLLFAVLAILAVRRLQARKGGNRKSVFIKLERSDPEDRQGLLGHDDFSIHDDEEETILDRHHSQNGSNSSHDGAGGIERSSERRGYLDAVPTRDEQSPGGSINHAIIDSDEDISDL